MQKSCYLLYLLLFVSSQIISQDETQNFRTNFGINISKTEDPINVDGIIEEETWNKADVATDFWQKLPFFKQDADPRTEVRLTYDDDAIYIATRCFQTEDIIIQSLKRDDYWDNDGIAIMFDPLNTFTNGYLFGTSAVGAQWDGLYSSTSEISDAWDNKWKVETNVNDSCWTAEFQIPFKIIRYNPTDDTWGINIVRNIMYKNEYHNWTAVPESFWPANPAFAGNLKWDSPPEKSTGNYNLIPYITTGAVKEIDKETSANFDVGLDARFSINSTINVDLTINPDFSQIEADELVTNLTRFNLFLPEKRTFFLENSDLFSDFGSGNIKPFFSRRIGLDNNLQSVPILYGVRMSGNLTNDLRIGAFNIHSKATENSFGQNQSAFALKKQFGRSFVQGLFLNRQAFDGTESVDQNYGRNLSLESAYFSDDGKIVAWLGGHHSFKPEINSNAGMYNTGFNFTNSSWSILTDFVLFQDNYFADLGFTPRVENYDAIRDTIIRVGFNSSYTTVDYTLRPKDGVIASHVFGIEHLMVFNPDWSFNERYNRLRYFLNLKTNHTFKIRLNSSDIDLLFPFSFTDSTPLPSDRYKNIDGNIEYQSDIRKKLSWSFKAQTGGFYNGRLSQLEFNANYRIQPWGNFSLGLQWNDIDFPDPYGQTNITALVSKIDIGFSRNIIWTTLFQLVDQSDFVGINSRLQWRYAPMSDIFLVYIDNYDILRLGESKLQSNNRALLLKASYWY